jgi:hypothetical protein
MTVKELQEILSSLDPDTVVVLSADSEGNNYSPLSSHSEGVYQAQTTWMGDFYFNDELGDDDYFQPEGETVNAIVLWPVN